MADPQRLTDVLAAAEDEGSYPYALACLLALNGLRVSEACTADITDLAGTRYQPTLRITGTATSPPTSSSTHEPTKPSTSPYTAASSLRRMVTREELWNGNREQLRNLLSTDPETNILRWAWTTHHGRDERFSDERADQRWGHVHFLRYDHDVDADRVLADI